MFHGQIDNHYPQKTRFLSILPQMSNLHIRFLSSTSIPDAAWGFMDATKTKLGYVLHLIGNKPQVYTQSFKGSVLLIELWMFEL